MILRVSAAPVVILSALVLVLLAPRAHAQELEPRAYSPNPVGLNFAVAGYVRSSGGVLFDPSLPFSDVEAELDSAIAGYGRTFAAFGRSASAFLALPYVQGVASGNVGESRREAKRSGWADLRLKLAINLLGGEAMTPAQFARRTPATTLGASLSVVAPTGQYDPDKLVNLGTNRWAFKPEIGVAHPMGRWYVEAYAGVWLFTDNDDFYGGQYREQDPIASLQAHVSYTFRPGLWIAANSTWYRGGDTKIDGEHKADLQENLRVGLTVSIPVAARQSIKLSWSDGTTTRIGGDFTTWGIAYQYAWFD